MNQSTEHTDQASEYRLREMEARMARRLDALESQRTRLRWTTRLVALALSLNLGAMAWVFRVAVPRDGAWTVETLSAHEVVLRDREGVERGELSTDVDGQTHFSLSDHDGRERIRLSILADGSPGFTISDADARPRAVLGYLPDGTANLVFADAYGISRAVVGVDPDGSSKMLFSDGSGSIRALVGVGSDGEPSVSTFEKVVGDDGGSRP